MVSPPPTNLKQHPCLLSLIRKQRNFYLKKKIIVKEGKIKTSKPEEYKKQIKRKTKS